MFCRVRPLNKVERESKEENVITFPAENTLSVVTGAGAPPQPYEFDAVFDNRSTQSTPQSLIPVLCLPCSPWWPLLC